MSVHLLRKANLKQSLCSLHRSLPRRRLYSALAAAHDHELRQLAPLTGLDTPASRSGPSVESSGPAREPKKKGRSKKKKEEPEKVPVPLVPREPSRVETYLASINAAGLEPTMADLERCRPAKHPPPNSPKFTEEYHSLVGTLCRSFSKDQLRRFLEDANMDYHHCRSGRRKLEYAESIIEQLWQWPSLKEIERAKRDRTEVSKEAIPVTAPQLFLILGNEGADLLQMSMTYDVHISLRKNPMAFKVEGLLVSLNELKAHLNKLKQKIIDEVYELPIPKTAIPPDMVQRISRLAGAYIENIGTFSGKIRICALNRRNLAAAQRLATRAVYEFLEHSKTPLLSYLPLGSSSSSATPLVMFPHRYSLYPFMSPRSLPWIMNTSGAFRLRRVGEWLGQDLGEDIKRTGGLAGQKGAILTTAEQLVDVKSVLLEALPKRIRIGSEKEVPSSQVITASMGHMLFTTKSTEQRAILVPPLKGDHPFGKILKWMVEHPVRTSFVPSLPAPLLNSAPADQRMIHRLVYRSVPIKAKKPDSEAPVQAHVRKIITFEITLPTPRLPGDTKTASSRTEGPEYDALESEGLETSSESSSPLGSIACKIGVESEVIVMMPDRPMDLRLSAIHSNEVQLGLSPYELQVYVAEIEQFLSSRDPDLVQPDPPLHLLYSSDEFVLHSSYTVRQSVEPVPHTTLSSDATNPDAENEPSRTTAVCESILDLESNQKSTHCEVTCDNYSSDESWVQFLDDIDKLTSMTYRPLGSLAIDVEEPLVASESGSDTSI